MAQDIERMVREVNKLITNELITAGGVDLPQIGSLSVEIDDSAEARRVVRFSTTERHTSLVAVIAMQTKCSVDQATALYAKWSEAVHKSRQVEIEGIGVVRGGRFEASPAIEQRLNPVVVESVATKVDNKPKAAAPAPKRGSTVVMWCVAVVAVVVAAVVIPQLAKDEPTESTPPIVEEMCESVVETKPTESVEVTEVVEVAEVTEVTEVTPTKTLLTSRKAKLTPNDTAAELFDTTMAESAKRPQTKYKVVYGVYRSKANAGRALVEAEVANSDDRTIYGASMRDGSYMVTLFESDHFYTSVSYMKRNNPAMGERLWVYDPNKM